MFLTESERQERQAKSAFKTLAKGPVESPVESKVVVPDVPITPSLVVVDESPGRSTGAPNLDPESRALIGAIANLPGSQKDLSEKLGISQSRVSNFKHGKINGKESDPLKERLNIQKTTIANTAAETLARSLGLITEEKMQFTSAKNLAGIAKDMSTVVKNLTEDKGLGNSNNLIFIHSPISPEGKGFHQEDYYEVIEVGQ